MTNDSITLHVTGMTCGGCAGRAERALAAVPGVTKASVNLSNQSATVTEDPDGNLFILDLEGARLRGFRPDGGTYRRFRTLDRYGEEFGRLPCNPRLRGGTQTNGLSASGRT